MRFSPKARYLLAAVFLPMPLSAVHAQTATQADNGAPSQNDPGSEKAAETDDFHVDKEIVVTAPYVQKLDILSGTSAISGDELAAKVQGQIGDSLTSLPGVSATSFSPGASRPVLRGFQGNRVAVLTDGIGNIDASNTSADHAVTIDSLTSERIEVLRGPAVLLFGGQAVGGAVNVIDKRIPRAVPDEPIHADALLGYSTAANEYSAGASVDFPIASRLVGHIDGSYRNSDDLNISGYVVAPVLRAETLALADEEQAGGDPIRAAQLRAAANQRGTLLNSATETWNVAGGLAFIDTGGNLGVSFNVYDTNYGVPGRPDSDEGPVSIDLRQYRADLRGEVELGSGLFEKLRIRAGYADYEHAELEGDQIGTRFLSKAIESRLELVQAKRGGWRGASGVQYQTRDFEAIGEEAFVPPSLSHALGLFTLQEFEAGNLGAEVALRYDTAGLDAQTLGFSRNFNNVSAAFGLGYTMGPLKIGANISRTGRAPTVEELLSNGPHIATQSFELGNPNLSSERSWNGEVYARYNSDTLKFNATLYANRFSNFIYESANGDVEDGLPVFAYSQGRSRVWGTEFEGSAKLAELGNFNLMADAVADYTHATIKGVGPVPRIPPLRLLGGLDLKSDNLDLRGEIEWTDSQNRVSANETATKGFTLVNATATWKPFGSAKNISLIASANNIFDVSARRAASFTKDFVPLAGRDFRLSARLSF